MRVGDRVLALLYERAERGLTATECATALGVSYASARWYLWKLSKEGWTTFTPEASGRRGGPFKRWRIS